MLDFAEGSGQADEEFKSTEWPNVFLGGLPSGCPEGGACSERMRWVGRPEKGRVANGVPVCCDGGLEPAARPAKCQVVWSEALLHQWPDVRREQELFLLIVAASWEQCNERGKSEGEGDQNVSGCIGNLPGFRHGFFDLGDWRVAPWQALVSVDCIGQAATEALCHP